MKKSVLFMVGVLSLFSTAAFAAKEGGGGDQYTVDFVQTATQVVYPWLASNGAKLNPPVDANTFLLAIDPKSVVSVDHVYESCDASNTGREVQACFNATTEMIELSRATYPLGKQTDPSKVSLVAHELFRKMGIEGDGYEITKQMAIAQADDPLVVVTTADELETITYTSMNFLNTYKYCQVASDDLLPMDLVKEQAMKTLESYGYSEDVLLNHLVIERTLETPEPFLGADYNTGCQPTLKHWQVVGKIPASYHIKVPGTPDTGN